MKWLALTLWAVMAAGSVAANAPETSPRPEARVTEPHLVQAIRPLARPASPQMVAVSTSGTLPRGPLSSLRPSLRPGSLIEKVMARRKRQREGMVCGTTDIQGEEVGLVPGRIQGCGIKEAVRIRSVAGVALSQEAVIDCATAQALNTWVQKSARPALRPLGQLRRLRVAAHYACRTRNNQPGARISEHGRGRAIDIAGFELADGRVVTVLNGWNSGSAGRALRQMHQGACGPFGTVLGPESDRFHRDHFHFDTARYRSGPYCR
jgi:hypothetical protein